MARRATKVPIDQKELLKAANLWLDYQKARAALAEERGVMPSHLNAEMLPEWLARAGEIVGDHDAISSTPAVEAPPPKALIVAQADRVSNPPKSAPKPPRTPDTPAEVVEALKGRKADNQGQIFDWVAENLFTDTPDVDSCPAGSAYSLWADVKYRTDFARDKFWSLWARGKDAAEAKGAFVDDGRSYLEAFTRFAAALGEKASE